MKGLKLKAVSFLIALISSGCVTGCLKSPGIEEPQIAFCTVISPQSADCVYPDIPGSEFTLPIVDLIGFVAVRPKGFSALISHHEILHREVDQCKAKK